MGYHTFFLKLVYALCFRTLLRSSPKSQTFIVHVELPNSNIPNLNTPTHDLHTWYNTFLPSSTLSTDEPPTIIHSYHNVFTGFAARLSPEQLKAMEKKPGFISARPEKNLSLHTTHSTNFLGLNQNRGFWRDTNYGRGLIIAVLDSGINPDHPSFNDHGMPPPPARWKGRCDFNSPALCNNKLIGARSFATGKGNGTPFDENGHGTHTAGTAAGNFVRGANVFGNANGTAAGVAPLAHLAVYKVCGTACSESDVLAGMDAAIGDGVDVISISLGEPAEDFYDEGISIGAFSAVERGIFVSAAAGNRGPVAGSIENGAPWILTVGASSVDRKNRATAVLGNNEKLEGESTFQPAGFRSTLLPLVYPGSSSSNNATFCSPASLKKANLTGKIVLCEFGGGVGRVAKGRAVRNAGGAAMILINQKPEGYTTISDSHVLPATHLSYADGLRIKAYLKSTSSPVATITFQGTITGDSHAPAVAAFSARGPNTPSPGILKPDIIGPGHNILAAWHVSVENNTNTKSNFNIISGTSMACPHLSGIAALLKNAHPDWSPAVIKSAIMTTAYQVNLAGDMIENQFLKQADVFATGSGHVNVLKATDPGLVYDIRSQDYVSYLCGLNYTDQQVARTVSRPIRCSEIGSISETELNYPSFSVVLGSAARAYKRTVTNVGKASSVYSAEIKLSGVDVRVEPSSLRFTRINETLTYKTTFTRSANATSKKYVQGFLTWSSAEYSVRSPIVVRLE